MNCVSLNAALLASRLEDYQSVFALMLFAVELFAFFPISCHYAKQCSFKLHVAIAILLFMIAAGLLSVISKTAMITYLLLVVFVTCVCPAWMLGLYQFKEEIHGPWDVLHCDGR